MVELGIEDGYCSHNSRNNTRAVHRSHSNDSWVDRILDIWFLGGLDWGACRIANAVRRGIDLSELTASPWMPRTSPVLHCAAVRVAISRKISGASRTCAAVGVTTPREVLP